MAARWRATAAVLVCALHLALFVPTIGRLVVDPGQRLRAAGARPSRTGSLPYRDQRHRVPAAPDAGADRAPAYFDDSTQGFVDGFMWEMLAFDLAIIRADRAGSCLGEAERVLSALGVYTVGRGGRSPAWSSTAP